MIVPASALSGLTGVALTDGGARAWWGCVDPMVPGRLRVMSQRIDERGPLAVLPADADGMALLHGYPGRGWMAHDDGWVWPRGGKKVPGSTDDGARSVLAEPCWMDGVVVAVREQSTAPRRSLVAVEPRTGRTSVLWAGSDFMGGLEPSPDRRTLSWLAWDDPDMPWDSARLMAGVIVDRALTGIRVLAGGSGGSAQPPAWTGPSTLLTSTEESGYWQLREIDLRTGAVSRQWPHADEAGIAYWRAGTRGIVRTEAAPCVLIAGRLWRVEADRLVRLDGDGYWSSWLAGGGRYVLGLRETASTVPTLTRVNVSTGHLETVYAPPAVGPVRRCSPHTITVRGHGSACTLRLYAPNGSAPWPTVLLVHGGPTLASPHLLDPAFDWLVRDGYAVVVVDYHGSAGYGRAFRDELLGRWGEIDVADCEAAAHHLRGRGLSDRIAIRGVSSGGWTVLHALARDSTPFVAGVALAPVTDVVGQRGHTPDFEKHYLDRLMGAAERSPSRLGLTPARPLLVVQGQRDEVVAPIATEAYVRGARQRGGKVEYLRLTDEGHLIANTQGIRDTRAAERAFYQRHLRGRPTAYG